MTKFLFYAAFESWVSSPDHSSKLNRTGTISEFYFEPNGSENIWTEPDQQTTDNSLLIYLGESYFETNLK